MTPWFAGGTAQKVNKPEKRTLGTKTGLKLPSGLYLASKHPSHEVMGESADARVNTGAALHTVDIEEERDPPSQPTPVSFPSYRTQGSVAWDTASVPNFQSLFSKIVKPADVSHHHAQILNIETCNPCPFDELLPLASDGTSYLPPLSPQQAIGAASYAEATKSDPVIARKRKEFDDRLAELRIDNETAFRTLSRSLKAGVKAPRLAHMRKFFEGLENMSRYWDCSYDDYFEVPDSAVVIETSAKRQRLDKTVVDVSGQIDNDLEAFATALGDHSGKTEQISPGRTDRDHNGASDVNGDRNVRSTSASPEPRARMRYKGRRTHSGREMPDQFRVDTARGFLEATAWPFQCSVAPPRRTAVVQFAKLNLPVRQTAAIHRIPRDRTRARQGRVEGPLAPLQVRSELQFVDEKGRPFEPKARLDFMRELGSLLQIAQERRREGKVEVKPGEGEWWTTKPRWGGIPDGEADRTSNTDILQAAEHFILGMKGLRDREKKGEGVRKKRTPMLLWKELKCGSGVWDAKTDYQPIGKTPSSPYDQVFAVSSLNHHISVLKLTVHVAYIDCLVSGEMPDPMPPEPDWCAPRLQRSEWFDLFDIEQRVEAFRGLWGVMAYLMRETGPQEAEIRQRP